MRFRSLACAGVAASIFLTSCGDTGTLWSTRLSFDHLDVWEVFDGRILVSGTVAELKRQGAPGSIQAIDAATGRIEWEHRVQARSRYGNPDSDPKGNDLEATFSALGKSYSAVRVADDTIEAIDSRTGAVRWRKTGVLAILGVSDGATYVILKDFRYAALDATSGNLIHTGDVFSKYQFVKEARGAVGDGREYVVADGLVHTFDAATGRHLWQADCFGTSATVAAAAGVVVVSEAGWLAAWDGASGELLWKQSVDIDLHPTVPRIVAGVLVTPRTHESKRELRAIVLRTGAPPDIPKPSEPAYKFDIEPHYDEVSATFVEIGYGYRWAESTDLRLRETGGARRAFGPWFWGWVQNPQYGPGRIYLLQTPQTGAVVLHALAARGQR